MQKWKWAFKKKEKKKNIQGMRVHLHHRRHGQWQHFKSDRHPPQHWWWVGRSKRGRGRWSMMSRWPYHRLNVIPVWLLHRCSSRGQRPCGVELKGKSASFLLFFLCMRACICVTNWVRVVFYQVWEGFTHALHAETWEQADCSWLLSSAAHNM